jgi:hypothetical protein
VPVCSVEGMCLFVQLPYDDFFQILELYTTYDVFLKKTEGIWLSCSVISSLWQYGYLSQPVCCCAVVTLNPQFMLIAACLFS